MVTAKIPRFSLRTLFVLVALVSAPMAWSAYNVRWIQQRRAFRDAHPQELCSMPYQAPWQLRIFGEAGYEHQAIIVRQQYLQEAKELFPEVNRVMAVSPEQLTY